MDSPLKCQESSKLHALHRPLASSARTIKFENSNENLNSFNQAKSPKTSQFKPAKFSSKEDLDLVVQRPKLKRTNIRQTWLAISEVNFMEYYKADREFALLSDAARMALLDDLFEIDKCYYLSRITCDMKDLNSNCKLKSPENEKRPFRTLRPCKQNQKLAKEFWIRPLGVRCLSPHPTEREEKSNNQGY